MGARHREGLKFAVLALGDSSYEHFCQTGRDFDDRLEALGAARLRERIDCDVDFDESAAAWISDAVSAFASEIEPEERTAAATVLPFSLPAEAPRYGRDRPFAAEVLENQNLNGRGSERETRHIELSLAGSGLEYAPGDVLGLIARNSPAAAEALTESLGIDPSREVTVRQSTKTFLDALLADFEITTPTPRFLRAWAERSGAQPLLELLNDESRASQSRYLGERWQIDIVREYPVSGISAQEFLGMLRPLQPREYSIASSLQAYPDEVHLTVAALRFEAGSEARSGVASGFIADAIEPGDRVDIYLRENRHFRLPADPDAPTIMIGPGTGIAPFRAFMQEREMLGAGGRNWLFFGNPHFRTDFLYQTEWQHWLADGLLSRLDVAFSRDQAEKVYVQHRLREQGAEIFRWLEEGAHVYVCGDSVRMAPDVHAALLEILETHGGLSGDGAQECLKDLQGHKRYQRETYWIA